MTYKRKKQVSKHKDIARLDQEAKRTYGWYVRISFRGKMHSKFFPDKLNGGKDSSLLAAISWRDDTRAKIGKPQTDRHIVSVTSNPTGIIGVTLSNKLNRYEVSWVRPDGRQGRTSVGIKKHGKAAALKLAIQRREEEEQKRLNA